MTHLQYGSGGRPNGGPGSGLAASADAAERGDTNADLADQEPASQPQPPPRPKSVYDVMQHGWKQVMNSKYIHKQFMLYVNGILGLSRALAHSVLLRDLP